MKEKINILMCGSRFDVKGGMVTVAKNYTEYKDWGEYNIIYIPTHIEKNKLVVSIYFGISLMKILFTVKTKKISVAHLHTAEKGSFYRKAILLRILKKFGIKVVLHHHAAEFEEFYASLNAKKRKFVNKTLELADMNIVLSKDLIKMITSKEEKATVTALYNAVTVYDVNPYNYKGNGILFLGRLGERKGVYDLLKAIRLIDSEIPSKVQFYLCGDGEIDKVHREVQKMKIEHRIAHIGWINADDKKKIYKNTIINVLPSYNEGLPMSILETMSYGIPNISTSIAAIPEVIENNKNGCLIKPGDVKNLAKNIKSLVDSEEKRKDMSNEAYLLIKEKFSIDNSINQLKKIYEKLMKE